MTNDGVDKDYVLVIVRTMAKVTSKLQVTVPRSLAERYKIRPGDEIQWESAGDTIRVIPPRQMPAERDVTMRLRLFDQATERQCEREAGGRSARTANKRGWSRDELYDRGRAR